MPNLFTVEEEEESDPEYQVPDEAMLDEEDQALIDVMYREEEEEGGDEDDEEEDEDEEVEESDEDEDSGIDEIIRPANVNQLIWHLSTCKKPVTTLLYSHLRLSNIAHFLPNFGPRTSSCQHTRMGQIFWQELDG